MRQFAGRVAVITGAAGGLGRAIAGAAAARGMRLVLADSDAAALARTTDELQAGGAEVLAMVCDVGKAVHVEELADAAMIRFHGIHLLVNAAGTAAGTCFVWAQTAADWGRVMDTNLWGAIHTVRVFTPLMLDCARRAPGYEGHIVNTVTTAGLMNAPLQGTVNVAQQAVVALAETLYHDLRLADAPLGTSLLCHDPAPATLVSSEPGMAADVARVMFDGVERGDFYVMPHPDKLPSIAARAAAILQGRPPDYP
jgi:NAD(P)-dependent dehydrogenase (short-subunit alcohol dehydrogenase family)